MIRLPPFKLSSVPTATAAAVAIATLALLFLGLSDDDVNRRFLRLDSASKPDIATVMSAAAQALRILVAIAVSLLGLVFVFVFARQDSPTQQRTVNSPSPSDAPLVLPQADAIEFVTASLAGAREATELCIWGFSLQWATPLYRFLREHKRPNLTVRLFVAGSRAWSMEIDYPGVSKPGLKARRDTTIHEWVALAVARMVREVRVYEVPLLPNDKGVRFGDEITLLGTYDHDCTPEGRLVFLPNPANERRFLVCHKPDTPAVVLIKHWCKRRLTCRQFDCEDITHQYAPAQ